MGRRQFLSGGTKAWDLPTTCGPSQESVTALLLSLSPRARAGSSLRDLQSNLFLSASLKYSFQSFCQQSDETNGKNVLSIDSAHDEKLQGGRRVGRRAGTPFTAAEERCGASDGRRRRGSAEERGGSPGPWSS